MTIQEFNPETLEHYKNALRQQARVRGGFEYTDNQIADIITERMHERARAAIVALIDDNSGFGLNASLIQAVVESLNKSSVEKPKPKKQLSDL